MKVGALDFEEEREVLEWIRSEFASGDLEIRLDANGAWNPDEACGIWRFLLPFHIHSIEQPIAAGQTEAMADLCLRAPIPVALDEELIGVTGPEARRGLLLQIRPAYIILKPGLLGGFSETAHWIGLRRS